MLFFHTTYHCPPPPPLPVPASERSWALHWVVTLSRTQPTLDGRGSKPCARTGTVRAQTDFEILSIDGFHAPE